ncbi:hypothetical protein DRW07_08340 [Alteromonas sediminis]|uniref:DUF3718 domain-containing protein n=1 Tax=Alteromonas sediminis TaxID=2259342 RepID=A0A3N5Y333_9ALTE|nr:hypothetical protein [Alteromonas sediminis]RPJ67513.1 hypothetical protein DRW07_08340 [Alteromonas sediminis]
MKNVKKKWAVASLIVAMGYSTAILANDKAYLYSGDLQYASFCRAVVLDDLRILKASLSRHVGRIAGSEKDVLRRVVQSDGLKCNGKGLIDFSKRRNARQVHTFLTTETR